MKKLIVCMAAALSLVLPLSVSAAGDMTDREYEAVYGDQEKTDQDSAVMKKKLATKNRYKRIVVDQSFAYYVDTKNMRWVPCPNASDQMIDVWVKMISFSEYYSEGDEAGRYSANYNLMHYYIRPKTQQLQLLCMAEVSGRPDGSLKDRPYNVTHWQNLVPGSIEDTIYHGVLDNIEDMPNEGKKSEIESIGDGVEDVFRIAL